jgi:hypothetical protein
LWRLGDSAYPSPQVRFKGAGERSEAVGRVGTSEIPGEFKIVFDGVSCVLMQGVDVSAGRKMRWLNSFGVYAEPRAR